MTPDELRNWAATALWVCFCATLSLGMLGGVVIAVFAGITKWRDRRR